MRRLLLVLVLLLAGCSAQADDRPLLVAAASDLEPAFTELARLHEQRTGTRVVFTFGSSGQLAQQVVNGAPFDLLASADERYVDQVLAAGAGEAGSKRQYALGRLAVWTPTGTATLEDLADPRFRRIAVANPEHAPYGAAAVAALARLRVQDRFVYGENVRDTLRLATSGNADAAVVALSLARAEPTGRHTEVPADAHPPLRQALVVTGERVDEAQAFADLVTGERGRDVLRRYGFGV